MQDAAPSRRRWQRLWEWGCEAADPRANRRAESRSHRMREEYSVQRVVGMPRGQQQRSDTYFAALSMGACMHACVGAACLELTFVALFHERMMLQARTTRTITTITIITTTITTPTTHTMRMNVQSSTNRIAGRSKMRCVHGAMISAKRRCQSIASISQGTRS